MRAPGAGISSRLSSIAINLLCALPLPGGERVGATGSGLSICLRRPSPIALRAIVCAVCLLPPTLLMGATLPAISRYVRTSREGVSWMGFFYGGNIVGAVFGCLLAGFYLLRVHDRDRPVRCLRIPDFSD